MDSKKLRICFLSFLIIAGIVSGIFQYVKTFRSEIAEAYQASKPVAGHNWSEMQCTSDICVTGGKIGIGTDSPSQKLEVNGSILATTDVCNGSGACLSQLASFVGAQPITGGTDHTRAMCTSAGGTLVDIGLANPICRFPGSCPSGWHQYFSWSTYESVTCTQSSSICTNSCTTGAKAWGDGAMPTCTYYTFLGNNMNCSTWQQPATCNATITEIGCY